MPYADFCPAVRRPFDHLSRRGDAEQISWGKLNRLPCTIAESTLRVLDGYGLRGKLPARPALARDKALTSSARNRSTPSCTLRVLAPSLPQKVSVVPEVSEECYITDDNLFTFFLHSGDIRFV